MKKLFNLGPKSKLEPKPETKAKIHTDSYIRSKSSFKKPKRPQSPRNPYRGRAYIPPKLVPCLSLKDAHNKLKSMGFTEGRSTANFWQDTEGRTAVIQELQDEGFTSGTEYYLYIRGNQPDQI